MNKFVVPGVVLAVSVALIFLAVVLCATSHVNYYDAKTSEQCSTLLNQQIPTLKNGDSCALWDKKQCRMGVYNNGMCLSPRDLAYPVIGGLGVILLVVGALLLFMRFSKG